ncbi:hypothetical protein WMF18_42875 [Sorangium sp. So ce315]|uniref:hypothetical protein n=1 Tax=Sorangium sp. So ce315 TaxID=3133299 RepID=UPI003F62626C
MMTRSNVRYFVLAGALLAAPLGCTISESDVSGTVASVDHDDRVITADDMALLAADDRLTLDLRGGAYRIAPSAGPVDLALIDVIGSSGDVLSLDEAIAQSVEAGKLSRYDLPRGIVVRAAGNEVVALALVNGLELVSKSSGLSSTWWRSPTVYCPGGSTLVGMGSSQTWNEHILFRGLIPAQGLAANPYGTQAAAQEDLAGTTINWQITAFATCSRQLSGLTVAKADSASSSSASRTWTVSCPSGKKVVGAGGTIMYGDGRVKIDEIRPNETLDQVTVTASEDQDGTSSNWLLRAYAVCADAPTGLVRVRATAANGWDRRPVVATCPAEKRLLSVAGGVDASVRTAMRTYEMVPSHDLKTAMVRVGTKGSSAGVTGEVRAYAICADG